MTLIPNWWRVLTGAWSCRIAIIGAVLGFVEMVVPAFGDLMPRGWFVGVCLLILAARLVYQVKLHRDPA